MAANHNTNWFWSDWLGDQAVRRLTPAERGVWIDLLALMAVACPTGYLCDETGRPLTEADVARVTNASAEEVAERIAAILAKGAASQDRDGRIYNRRMVRDAAIAAKKRKNGRLGGAATRLKWQAFSGLPRQNAWQVPQQTGPPSADLLRKKEIHSSFVLPRTRATGVDNSETAPDEPPQAAGDKKASEASRAELEAMFAAKRKQG